MNRYGSRRRREGCFDTPSRDALQSIQSGGLVVAALEHPTPDTQRPPNTQRPATQHPSNTQRPKANLHGSLRQREGRFRTTYRGASQSIPSLRETSSSPPVEASNALQADVTKQKYPPWGDPAFRVEQEMKGGRPKRPPFNQIRLPLQARAGNRPTN